MLYKKLFIRNKIYINHIFKVNFMFISKYLYPEGYKFGEEERYIFNTAVLLGQNCPTDLSTVNFDNKEILSMNLNDL